MIKMKIGEFISNLIDIIENAFMENIDLEIIRNYIDDSTNDYLNLINQKEYTINYPILEEKQLQQINDIFLKEEYPKEFIPLVDKLCEYIGQEFLIYCASNLKKTKAIKDKKYKLRKYNYINSYVSGAYISEKDVILYYENDSLTHEFLHMASTPKEIINENEYYSGFRFDYGDQTFQKGLNEGYTELLTSRIFKNENYNTDSLYKPNVYILRIFELLYANKKYMERDYFLANNQSPMQNFIKFGSQEEYIKLLKYLDYFAETKVIKNEDIEMFDHLKKIIERTYDDDKILEAQKIEEEYFESEKKETKKIFSLFK